MKFAIVFVLTAATGIAQSAQPSQADHLSSQEVQAAMEGKGRDRWVRLTDTGMIVASAFVATGSLAQEPSITIAMPEAVIADRAQRARKQFLEYEPSESETARSLMIFAESIAIGSPSGPLCSTIRRVILVSDKAGTKKLEASSSEPVVQGFQNFFGATARCQSVLATFPLSQVRGLQDSARKGEFFVAVVYEGLDQPRLFKIKRPYLRVLGMDASTARGSAPTEPNWWNVTPPSAERK